MIAIDIVFIPRMQSLIARRGLSFACAMAGEHSDSPRTLAGAYAAKEALAKAKGIGVYPAYFREARLEKAASGRPFVRYRGRYYAVSIAHDGAYAMAAASARAVEPPCVQELDREVLRRLPPRDPDADKRAFGRVAVFAGSDAMTGCAALTVEAAMRSGAGYVYLYAPPSVQTVVRMRTPEAITGDRRPNDALPDAEAYAAGPGLGEDAVDILDRLAATARPVVLDADILRAVADSPALPKNCILTPHEGEAAHLLGTTREQVHADRRGAVRALSRRFGGVAVLKGRRTLVAKDGEILWENPSGNAGMATAGSGDVLTGVIAALAAGGASAVDAAIAGVYVHGRSGDIMAQRLSERSLKAGDIIRGLGRLYRKEER